MHQTDITFYGTDLADYIDCEFIQRFIREPDRKAKASNHHAMRSNLADWADSAAGDGGLLGGADSHGGNQTF